MLGLGRLGFLVNFLSHSVLVGFTAAAAIIIGFSQAKHIFGISTERKDHFYETVLEVGDNLSEHERHHTGCSESPRCVALFALKKFAPAVPAALVVVVGSILAVRGLRPRGAGVSVVGDIPDILAGVRPPRLRRIARRQPRRHRVRHHLVGFMESIAVAKVYARRHRYEIDPNSELIGLGAANVASGLFGGYPVTGGFSRTAVNDTAGARTPLASLITAGIVLATIAFLTPLFASLPNAALGAIIIMAVIGLVDVAEMRHIAEVKKSDLIGTRRRLLRHPGARHRTRHRRRRRGLDARRVRPHVDAAHGRARPRRRHDELPQRRPLPRSAHHRRRSASCGSTRPCRSSTPST